LVTGARPPSRRTAFDRLGELGELAFDPRDLGPDDGHVDEDEHDEDDEGARDVRATLAERERRERARWERNAPALLEALLTLGEPEDAPGTSEESP